MKGWGKGEGEKAEKGWRKGREIRKGEDAHPQKFSKVGAYAITLSKIHERRT